MTKCVCMCVRSVKSDSLQPYGLYSSRLFCPCDFRGKNTWTGCHFLLQGIFPAQDSNPHLSFSALAGGFFTTMSPEKPLMTVWSESEGHSAVSDSLQPHGLYSPWNSPGKNTGVVVISSSRGSSQPREWTQVSHVADRFFTSWATGEIQWLCD